MQAFFGKIFNVFSEPRKSPYFRGFSNGELAEANTRFHIEGSRWRNLNPTNEFFNGELVQDLGYSATQ